MGKIVIIGAHFDDAEIGCGGTILKFADVGYDVSILVITDSEYIYYDGTTIRSREQAFDEGSNAAKYMNADLYCLHAKNKKVVCNSWLIEEINDFLDKEKPEYIFSHWIGDLHEDHHEVARATIVAARHYPSVLMYRSNWYHSNIEFVGNVYVDISRYINKKMELLKLHETEYKRRGEPWLDFTKVRAREAGLRIGVEYAEEFSAVKLLLG